MSALTISKENKARVKGMGFLNNRGTDLFSARILTVNGKVTAAQHRCMAEAAEKFGNGTVHCERSNLVCAESCDRSSFKGRTSPGQKASGPKRHCRPHEAGRGQQHRPGRQRSL